MAHFSKEKKITVPVGFLSNETNLQELWGNKYILSFGGEEGLKPFI